jgi:hypothetical protein
MPSAGFEPAISATKQLHTFALDRTVTETGSVWNQPSNVRGGDVFVTIANLQEAVDTCVYRPGWGLSTLAKRNAVELKTSGTSCSAAKTVRMSLHLITIKNSSYVNHQTKMYYTNRMKDVAAPLASRDSQPFATSVQWQKHFRLNICWHRRQGTLVSTHLSVCLSDVNWKATNSRDARCMCEAGKYGPVVGVTDSGELDISLTVHHELIMY